MAQSSKFTSTARLCGHVADACAKIGPALAAMASGDLNPLASLLGISTATAAELYQNHKSERQSDRIEASINQIKLLLETNTSLAVHDRDDLTVIRSHLESVHAANTGGALSILPDFYAPLSELLAEAVETQLTVTTNGQAEILKLEENYHLKLCHIINKQPSNIRELLAPEISSLNDHLDELAEGISDIKSSQERIEYNTDKIPEILHLLQELIEAKIAPKTRNSFDHEPQQKENIPAEKVIAEKHGLTVEQLLDAIRFHCEHLKNIKAPSYDELYEMALGYIALKEYGAAMSEVDSLIEYCKENQTKYWKDNETREQKIADAYLLKLEVAKNIHCEKQIIDTSRCLVQLFDLDSDPQLWLSVAEPTADTLLQLNLYDQAEPIIRKAISCVEDTFDRDLPIIFPWLILLNRMLLDTRRFDGAFVVSRRIVESSKLLGARYLGTQAVGTALSAFALFQMNDFENAEAQMRAALHMFEHSFHKYHFNVSLQLNNLALLLMRTRRTEEAIPLLHRAISIAKDTFGENHPITLKQLRTLDRALNTNDKLVFDYRFK